jgi:GntR family transcriptional regulator, rspAB operon transcriptional repressor
MKVASDSAGQLLTDRMFRLLRNEIITGGLKAGEPFNEGAMAKRFKASRTPIREACNRLRNAGLLIATPNKGYMVAPITVKDVLNVYQLRLVVEPVCAEHAARNLSGEEVDKLDRLLEPERKHPENEPHLALIELNKAFHLLLAQTTNNDRIVYLIDSLLLAAARMDYAFMDLYPASWTGHAEIMVALRAHSAADARQAMYHHIQLSQQRMSRIFSTDQLPPSTVSLERSSAVLK